ncbi:MAG: DUF2336 domain-containing protein [Alphaproteobacteria bacterium]|nr:DUF2336 domain-containing protein [Alphaproteobacteria bacterium]
MNERSMHPTATTAGPERDPAASARSGGEKTSPETPRLAASSNLPADPSPDTSLGTSDISNLRNDRMGAGAVKVARKVATAYAKSSAKSDEREHAEAIFSEWLQRGAEVVRATLAKHLASCGFLPHRFACAMAEDVETVAVPMLEHSEVLTEEDLCRIAAEKGLPQQVAIAGREFVPHQVSDVLIGRREPSVAIRLLGNEGAKLSEPALHRIMDAFNRDTVVVDALTERGRVPSSVADRIVTLIAEPAARTVEQEIQSTERAHPLFARTLNLVKPRHRSIEGIEASKLADQFAAAGRLTPAFLLRALCDNRRSAFEAGIARLAGVPIEKTIALLTSGDEEALTVLFKRTGVQEPFRRAFHDGVKGLIRSVKFDPAAAMTAEEITEAVMEVYKNDDAINPDEYKSVLARLYAELSNDGGDTATTSAA